MPNKIDQLCVNTIRTLSVDSVQKANSGHPGMPMGMADTAYVLWSQFLRHNPKNPAWPNRDRFVLSGGHGSMLLYSLLYLTGYDLPLEELQSFRQWGSRTPGHPEYGLTPGVETTTGPLGQGLGNAVGMAMAAKFLAAVFNKPGFPLINHTVYVTVGDGDLMEGVASEAASLAGHLGLDNLVVLYDDNGISIDGPTSLAFTEDRAGRFVAYNWQVQQVDGHDRVAVAAALLAAREEKNRPSLICCRTHIGFGSPNMQDTAKVHGSPLGDEEVVLTKEKLDWPQDAQFLVPDEVLACFRQAVDKGQKAEAEWQAMCDRYAQEYPDLAALWQQVMAGELPEGWEQSLPTFKPEDGALATRSASGKVLNALAPVLPTLLGGSADLAPSNNTELKGLPWFSKEHPEGRNIHFGVREHAMGSALNGMMLHGGVFPYGGTFLVFSDYMRPAVRLAALMEIPVTFVFTHDSIGLGEDGPTHQPVEHLAALRAIPHLTVIRPADANETAEAWWCALTHREGPTALALSRQKLPTLDRSAAVGDGKRGAYIVQDSGGTPDLILIATGSEVALALEARQVLVEKGIKVRVVSMPSWEVFERQPAEYQEQVLPSKVKARLSIEAGVTMGWETYVGSAGDSIGLNRFGASAPAKTLMRELGFNVDNVVQRAWAVLGRD
jgi:transketolase